MTQTAVEWLIDQLVKENEVTLKGENYKLFDQALQMEREQHESKWAECNKIIHDGFVYIKYNDLLHCK